MNVAVRLPVPEPRSTVDTMTISGQLVGFVPSTDLDVSEMFYVDTLGFGKIARDHFALVLDGGGGTPVRVTLVQSRADTGYTVLGWQVADLNGTVEALRAKASTSFDTTVWTRTTTTCGRPPPTVFGSRGSATRTATCSR